mmetsp:Transcript_29720/g.69247  ORF Transcript_29720/g.69247 Transcript_29720/m.69247 type:complete len:487 (-) Transcript_29720:1184-2644(-)
MCDPNRTHNDDTNNKIMAPNDTSSIMDHTLICETDEISVLSDLTDERSIEASLYYNTNHRNRWNLGNPNVNAHGGGGGGGAGMQPHQHFRRNKLQPYQGIRSNNNHNLMTTTTTTSPAKSLLPMGQQIRSMRGMEERRVELPPMSPPALARSPQKHLTMPPQESPKKEDQKEKSPPKMPTRRRSGVSIYSTAASMVSEESTLILHEDEEEEEGEDHWTVEDDDDDDDDDESTILSSALRFQNPTTATTATTTVPAGPRSVDDGSEGESTLVTNHASPPRTTTTIAAAAAATVAIHNHPYDQYDSSESTDDAVVTGGWVCDYCTFHNTHAEFLSCEVCGLVRMDRVRDVGGDGNNNNDNNNENQGSPFTLPSMEIHLLHQPRTQQGTLQTLLLRHPPPPPPRPWPIGSDPILTFCTAPSATSRSFTSIRGPRRKNPARWWRPWTITTNGTIPTCTGAPIRSVEKPRRVTKRPGIKPRNGWAPARATR